MEPPPSLAGVNSVRPCTLFNDKFFSRKTCCCVESPPSVAVLKSFCRKPFENSPLNSVRPCTLFNDEICA